MYVCCCCVCSVLYQGNIKDMVADLRAALLWTVTNCAMFGGDPEQIMLAGQSAGAHISLCTLVELYEESLARQFVRRQPLATLHVGSRTVHLRSARARVQPEEEEEEEGDNLLDCIWRTKDSDRGNDSDIIECDEEENGAGRVSNDQYAADNEDENEDEDEDEEGEEEGTDEEEVTVNTEDATGPDMTTASCSAASSFEDRTPSFLPETTCTPSRPHMRRSTMPFPTDSSDYMEYKVTQQDNGDDSDADNGDGDGDGDVDGDDRHRHRHRGGERERERGGDGSSPHRPRHHSSIDTTEDEDDHVILRISDIKMFIGISGPYNMVGLMQHLHARGLDVSILHYIFAFDVKKYSPTLRLAKLMGKKLTNNLSMQCMSTEESSLSIYKYLFGGSEGAQGAAAAVKKQSVKSAGDDLSDEDSDGKSPYHPDDFSTVSSIENYVVDKLFPKKKNGNDEEDEEEEEKEGDVEEVEMNEKQSLSPSSATAAAAAPVAPSSTAHLLQAFPAVALFHGSKDKSIPSVVSDELEALLLSGGVPVSSRVYSDMSHTDPILENVLEGNTELVQDMINVIENNMALGSSRNNAIMESVVTGPVMTSGGSGHGPDSGNEKAGRGANAAPNSERCDIYLHNNQTVSWPISKGMMRIARMMNPF